MLSRLTSVGQLRPDWQNLVEQARSARERAFAPHSGFRVGAAVLTASGEVYRGCNIEIRPYDLGLCAERVAIFNAMAAGERMFSAIAVIADVPSPVPPCGACRQVIAELLPNAEVILANLAGYAITTSDQELLPSGSGS